MERADIRNLLSMWILVAVNLLIYIAASHPHDLLSYSSFTLLPDYFTVYNEPWRLGTYMFLNLSPFHLLFNVLLLIFSCIMLPVYDRSARLWIYYLGGGIIGGLAYVLVNAFTDIHLTHLSGSSAAVCSVLAAAVVRKKGISFKIFLKKRTISPFISIICLTVVLASGIFGRNAAGALAHIAGLFSGVLIASLFNRRRKESSNSVYTKFRVSGYTSLNVEERHRLLSLNDSLNKGA